MRHVSPGGGMPALDLRPTPVVLRLMIAMVGIHLLLAGLVNLGGLTAVRRIYIEELALTPASAIFELRLWQVATYSWLHDLGSAGHIIANMLGLFFLGPPLERRWGGRHFFWFWFWSCLVAGFVTILLGLFFQPLFGGPVVGASGGVMALLAAFSLVMPDAVILLFFILPIQARYIVWIAVGIDTLFFFSGSMGLAWHTHMGGVLAAWLLITGNWRPKLALDRARLFWLRLRGRERRSHLRVVPGPRGDRTDRHDMN